MNDATVELDRIVEERRWSWRLIGWVGVLVLANRMADTVITTPQMVTTEMLEYFGTNKVAWLNSSAMLAGAICSPLLAKSADVFGRRRVLLITIFVSGAGSVICLIAPNLALFLLGRFLQGSAMAVVFLTVALTRQLCPPRVAMTAIGIVTSASAIVGIVEPFLMEPLIAQFGFQSVFAVSVVLAAAAGLSVRLFIPESPILGSGRIDVGGALLLGGGLAGVLGYASLGQDLGWLSGGMIALLAAGGAALVGWAVLALRVDEPIVDIRALSRPLLLTLLAVVLAAGSFQSTIQLMSLIAKVSPELGLGYGLAGTGPSALLFAAPAPGIILGGIFAGWLATRIGPARTLLGGIVIGTVGTFTMLAGVSSFPLMVASVGLLGMAAGAINTSGFNLATGQAPPERHGVVSGLVSVMLAVGGAVVNVAGTAVLNATTTEAEGAPQNSAAGVYLYILMAGILFVTAVVTATVLTRKRPTPRQTLTSAGSSGRPRATPGPGATQSTRHRAPGPAVSVATRPDDALRDPAPYWSASEEAPTQVVTEPVPTVAGSGVRRLPQRLTGGAGVVLLAGVVLFIGTQIVTADDGTALLGSRQVTVGPAQERVEVGALFGSVDVVVPDGVSARVVGRVVFGGTECERACSEPGREIVVDAVGAFGMVDVMRPGEILADEREEVRENAEDAAEAARERAQEARDDG
ncbi:MFS transporter [Pseudonocardia parietis]|uniref:MFS family permease n=1 Tax=Pseudonocardia parietis TaxID=570936 RepID=A0ABS4VTZ1_9PSEU|nr:MFS transporter [Pseudonocardia parietis]MBP2367394.1 MFS family permease [Pseudonocardia parietis]